MKDLLYDRIAQSHGYPNTKAMLQDLIETEGMTLNIITNMIGCSLPTLKALREQHGIKDRIKPPSIAEIITPKELKNLSCNQLAKKYNISRSHAWRLKREAKTLVPRTHKTDAEV